MRTIKDVQHELKEWGAFWARQESGQGYASKSNVQVLADTLKVGCAIQGTAYLISHRADSISVPRHITRIDKDLEKLSRQCKIALRQRYISRGKILYFDSKEIYLFWVEKAERSLL